jgi:branched-chain amino acid transport system substrate-binding protein
MMSGTKRKKALCGSGMLALLTIAACGSGSPSGGGGGTVGPVKIGEIFPLTGAIAASGVRFLDGAKTGVADVNANGGVLGQKIQEYTGDDAGDAVDAVPALKQLLTHSPTFLAGPLSPTFPALQAIIDQSKIVAMAGIPSSQFDSLKDPYVYRTVVSDSVLGTAMAYYALSQHLMTCSFLVENIQSAQGLVAPIQTAYEKHGGKILDNEVLDPTASSYRTEIEKAFANNPQCIFSQMNEQNSGTLFSEMRELGKLNVPIVGTDAFTDPIIAQAVGLPDMTKWVTGMSGATPAGPSYSYFSSLYMTAYGKAPGAFAAALYDGVVIASLAMDIAKTTDPTIWKDSITKVTNSETATECTNYAKCYALVQAGTSIDYEGASGPMDFNSNHSVFSGIVVQRFDLSGKLQTVSSITADQLNGY